MLISPGRVRPITPVPEKQALAGDDRGEKLYPATAVALMAFRVGLHAASKDSKTPQSDRIR